MDGGGSLHRHPASVRKSFLPLLPPPSPTHPSPSSCPPYPPRPPLPHQLRQAVHSGILTTEPGSRGPAGYTGVDCHRPPSQLGA